jgi:hypothetical protein
MSRIVVCLCVLLGSAVAALGQAQKLPADLANLPEQIRTLNWKAIDVNSASTLEHSRALLLLNHALDELSANVTAEADLMSLYIEKQNLGKDFASTPPPPAPPQLSYADAEKVAIALLRGPMSGSYYATELGDIGKDSLLSYEQMYQRTCQRRWGEFDESRHLLRCMTSFLGNSGKLQDYDGWATAEAVRREQEAQQRQAQQAKTSGKAQTQAQINQMNDQLQPVKGALSAAEYQEAATKQQAGQAQQAAAQAQGQQAGQTVTPAGQPAQAVNGGYVVDQPYYGYAYPYGGYGAYGYTATGAYAAGAAAGASAANAANNQTRTAVANGYHGAGSTWNREPAYNSSARAQTEARMSSFHGVVGRR